jgi:prevent-host-death family protein
MTKTISATEARIHLGEVLDQVETRGSRVVIERAGKPVAMLIPMEDSRALAEPKSDIEALIERARKNREAIAEWRAKHRPGKPFPDIAEMIHEMREERDAQLLDNLLRR